VSGEIERKEKLMRALSLAGATHRNNGPATTTEFPLKAGQCVRISGQVLGEKLERHETMETSILSFVNDSHPAATELLSDNLLSTPEG
jgi:hypothetical protein